MPTIYTFGDPELLREALLALATIFNLVEWSDPGSALGLGGNMLAVALIGLLAVAIAGVSSQQVRVDYLFLALILFGVMFSAKTDVNVEDIQTGDSAVVADIPIGIAYVAAAASGAAQSLTQTTSAALQRPGSATSLITQGGFMDPLRVVLALRTISFSDISENVQKSLLEYYKICVGRTAVNNPGQFDMDLFLADPDPVGYLLDPGNVQNFSTIYYSDANPGGVAQSCWATAPLIASDIDNLTSGVEDGLEAYLTRALGAENYNTSYDLTDINDTVDILFRGAMTGQDFMSRLMLRNFHNTGEAWRLAEYGSNQSQYVATVTEAFETQRVTDATKGTVWLQYMMPLMSFVQFIFFSIAPFVALVMIANPFAAAKVLGTYLLFGVWSYMWMPIAAVINHYMEITFQNAIEFAGTGALNTGHTALAGFDDFYNMAATKISIGSTALAATPVITLAILTASVMGIANVASKIGQARQVNSSIASPSLAKNAPLVSVGGRFSAAYGTPLGLQGGAGASSTYQDGTYKQLSFGRYSQVLSQSEAAATARAGQELSQSIRESGGTISDVIQRGGKNGVFASHFQTTGEQRFIQALEKGTGINVSRDLSAGNLRALSANTGVNAIFAGVREETANNVLDASKWAEVQNFAKKNAALLAASVGESVGKAVESSGGESGSVTRAASSLRQSQQEFESSQEYARRASEAASTARRLEFSTLANTTELSGRIIRDIGASAPREMYSFLRHHFGEDFATSVMKGSEAYFARYTPMGIDGKRDDVMDLQDKVSSVFAHLADTAHKDPKAALALMMTAEKFAGLGGSDLGEELRPQFATPNNVGATLADGEALQSGAEARTGAFNASLAQQQGNVNAEAQGRIQQGGRETPVVGSSDREIVGNAFADLQAGYGVKGAPTSDEFNKTLSDVRNLISADSVNEKSASMAIQDLVKSDPGFTRFLEAEAEQLASLHGNAQPGTVERQEIDARADQVVAKLQRAMIGQFDNSRGEEVQQIYADWQQEGFTKRQAAFATMGQVGAKRMGAMDALYGGAVMMAGSAMAGRQGSSMISMARLGGGAAGLAAYAAAVGVAKSIDDSSRGDAEDRIAELLKQDFREAGGRHADKFDALIDQANGSSDRIFEVLDTFYESGAISEEDIARLEESRKPTFWETVGEAYTRQSQNPNFIR